MDIQLLKTIVCVADVGSFSNAADAMNCVQSNITARIKRLETHYNQIIFERGRGGARLTPFGLTLCERAKYLIAEFDQAERELMDTANHAAPLRLGSMETTAAARLPHVLKELRHKCPKSKISLRTGPTATLLTLLWEQKIDACFVAAPVDESRFKSTFAFTEKLMQVVAYGQEATGPLLVFSKGCSYRSLSETWLRSQGRLDTEMIEMGSFEGILGCVEAGMGFAVLPQIALKSHIKSRDLVCTPLPEPYCTVETRLATRFGIEDIHSLQQLRGILSETKAA